MIYLSPEAMPGFCHAVKTDSPIMELVILATCNRFEIYYTCEDLDDASNWLLHYLASAHDIPVGIAMPIVYQLRGDDVIRHLFNVAAGVESMVFGEDEILAQVKKAYLGFQSFGTTGALTNKLFQTAMSVGKRARHETEISRGSYSVSSIAIDAVRELRLDYFDHAILIVGTGIIGMRAVKKLVALGHPDVTVSNRTLDTATRVATQHGLKVIDFELLPSDLQRYDIVIVATASTDYVITPKYFGSHSATNLIIDLSVPRNVDPDVETESRRVMSVDGLKQIADKNVARRRKEFLKVQTILGDEQEKLMRWMIKREGVSIR